MRQIDRVAEWLNVRPGEIRLVALTFAGAFAMMSFVVVARALREALYLSLFDASTLPYVTGASVGLGLIGAALLSRSLARRQPRSILRVLIIGLSAGLVVLYLVLRDSAAAVVAFYIATAVGTLLVTSGFWLIVTELFVVREAKRLFGLISAGGTFGLLIAGSSVGPLLSVLASREVVLVLVATLLATLAILEAVPEGRLEDDSAGSAPPAVGEGLALVFRTPHVGLIALILMLVAAASAVIDFQFKEAVQEAYGRGPAMATFFGRFYAWTGGLALLVQVLVTTRFMAGAGMAWSVALVPLVLAAGSLGLLAAPGLLLATGLRGADSTLRKSLFRSVMEFLWVPVPTDVRRRTKTFVDTVADNAGEGVGALLVFLWVTLPGLPSRWLSVFVVVLCVVLVFLARRIGSEYFVTLRSRLSVAGKDQDWVLEDAGTGADRLGATLSRIDITRVLGSEGIDLATLSSRPDAAARPSDGDEDAAEDAVDEDEEGSHIAITADVLRSGDVGRIAELLRHEGVRDPDLVPVLVRLLARDRLVEPAAETLVAIGSDAVGKLCAVLADDSADFVIRRRIPQVLARIPDAEADRALVEALCASRFEVRYRAAVALGRRRAQGLPEWSGPVEEAIWKAVRSELGRGRAVWELARLLDDKPRSDPFVEKRLGVRGELSLEHTFRMLSLVLDEQPLRAAYRGILSEDEEARSFALEYLDQVLPSDVRDRLWPFVGDLSESQERRAIRPLDAVVGDLMRSGATLFGDESDRAALRRYLERAETGTDTPDAPEPDTPEPDEGREP
ncbi:MAG: hypothetical protein RRA92_09210 [Gemmatimonadota bacterium]|nr:hypothetical protein [Gemmatimonadota bacterium]